MKWILVLEFNNMSRHEMEVVRMVEKGESKQRIGFFWRLNGDGIGIAIFIGAGRSLMYGVV